MFIPWLSQSLFIPPFKFTDVVKHHFSESFRREMSAAVIASDEEGNLCGGLFTEDCAGGGTSSQMPAAASPPPKRFELRCPIGRSPLSLTEGSDHHSLWGHRLWNAAKRLMDEAAIAHPYCVTKGGDESRTSPAPPPTSHARGRDEGLPACGWTFRGKTVIELGAGLGVPSIIAHRCGAQVVVATDYPDESLLSVLRANVLENVAPPPQESVAGESDLTTPASRAPAAHVHIEPLKWGDRDHIRHCLEHLGGGGYDVVILSDLVFNHVCHHELLMTVAQLLAKSPNARGLVTFTHHRPHLMNEDLAFFDKLRLYGLEIADDFGAKAYSPMFEDDPGPLDMRSAVHFRTIKLHVESLSGSAEGSHLLSRHDVLFPLDVFNFDVVVEGTGLSESILSMALARLGVKVLHLDPADHYGMEFATERVTSFDNLLRRSPCVAPESIFSLLFPSEAMQSGEGQATREEQQADNDKILRHREWALDVLPQVYTSGGDTMRSMAESPSRQHFECRLVQRLAIINVEPADSPTSSQPGDQATQAAHFVHRLSLVPLSRADVFKSKSLTPMIMRRLMKLMQDVMGPCEACEGGAAGNRSSAATPAPSFLDVATGPRFMLPEAVVRLITLHGLVASDTSAAGSTGAAPATFSALKNLASSVGMYNGETPFLVSQYGASELPQIFCRGSAVWGSECALHRHVASLYSPPPRKTGCASSAKSISSGVLLNNGQWIGCSAVVMRHGGPTKGQRLGSVDPPDRCARVIILSRTPLIAWEQLEQQCGDTAKDSDQAQERQQSHGPVAVGALTMPRSLLPSSESEKGGDASAANNNVVVMFHQLSDASFHAPEGFYVIHFSAFFAPGDREAVSGRALFEGLRRCFASVHGSANFSCQAWLQAFAFDLMPEWQIQSTQHGGNIVPQEIDKANSVDEVPTVVRLKGRHSGFNDAPHFAECRDALEQIGRSLGKHPAAPSAPGATPSCPWLPPSGSLFVPDDTNEEEP